MFKNHLPMGRCVRVGAIGIRLDSQNRSGYAYRMELPKTVQGRVVCADDVELIRELIASNPSWHRTRLSRELCALWDWHNGKGQPKDMACRTLLLKLEQAGLIVLPKRQHPSVNHRRKNAAPTRSLWDSDVEMSLREVGPVCLEVVEGCECRALFAGYLSHHYLGYTGAVGENMKYLAVDERGQVLACLLFGSAAWKAQARDEFIGWDEGVRRRRLHLVTNNMRFLILPWVRVPHLASHLLGQAARRLSADWEQRYGHPIHLLETFVERDRFRGTAYRAANWLSVGETQGRTRNDRHHRITTARKELFVYPLSKNFRQFLCSKE